MAQPPQISVDSVTPNDKDGYITKQGGKIKTWKRRWLVLKGNTLYYFKTKKDRDVTGTVELTKDSFIRKEKKERK